MHDNKTTKQVLLPARRKPGACFFSAEEGVLQVLESWQEVQADLWQIRMMFSL
jgi:hypothetical protein